MKGLEIRIDAAMLPGVAVQVDRFLFVRHMSELLLMLSGARWHPHGHRCPTWTDAAECRCMLGDEA